MLKKIAEGLIDTAPEVREALADGRPVVALESTIITHGMPYPQNVETARAVEAIVRAEGAVPATIGVIGGRIVVGVEGDALDRLGSAEGVVKASRRDLAAAVVAKADAGTTVAATMAIAARAGIEVFATGGIGGVHRGAEATFDISADLVELSRTPVAVVSAGCKSILDIGKTLEFLETQGVPVVGYRTDEFPAFFARDERLQARPSLRYAGRAGGGHPRAIGGSARRRHPHRQSDPGGRRARRRRDGGGDRGGPRARRRKPASHRRRSRRSF